MLSGEIEGHVDCIIMRRKVSSSSLNMVDNNPSFGEVRAVAVVFLFFVLKGSGGRAEFCGIVQHDVQITNVVQSSYR